MFEILHYVHQRVANIHWELPENLNISGKGEGNGRLCSLQFSENLVNLFSPYASKTHEEVSEENQRVPQNRKQYVQ